MLVNNKNNKYDIIIVGAGIAGLYMAYKCVEKGYNVLIFEKENRFGGRIQTKYNQGPDKDLQYDCGPARISKHHHRTLKLINKFKLPTGEVKPFRKHRHINSDGSVLLAMDNNQVYISDTQKIKTPNLCGRVIVGRNPGNSPNDSTLTTRTIGDIGGEEQHTLTTAEMPTHNHLLTNGSPLRNGWGGATGMAIIDQTWQGSTLNTGGNQPHNNMQPYLVCNYIIKKPTSGGINNKISPQPFTPASGNNRWFD